MIWNRAGLVVIVVALIAWSVGAIAAGVWWFALIAAVLAIVVGAVVRRTERVALMTDGETLVITNFVLEHRFTRDGIARFTIESTFRRRSLFVRTRDFESVECSVMAPRRWQEQPDLDECHARLAAWLAQPRRRE